MEEGEGLAGEDRVARSPRIRQKARAPLAERKQRATFCRTVTRQSLRSA